MVFQASVPSLKCLFLIVPPVLVAAERFDEAICDLVDDNGIKIWVSREYCPNRLWREAFQAGGTRDLSLGVLGVGYGNIVRVDGGGGNTRLP